MSKILSVRQFGIRDCSPKIMGEVDDRVEAQGEYEPKRVALNSFPLRATQEDVYGPAVDYYQDHPRGDYTRASGDNHYVVPKTPPMLVKYKGEHVIWNGHHRIAAARRRGQKTMRVDYQDLDD